MAGSPGSDLFSACPARLPSAGAELEIKFSGAFTGCRRVQLGEGRLALGRAVSQGEGRGRWWRWIEGAERYQDQHPQPKARRAQACNWGASGDRFQESTVILWVKTVSGPRVYREKMKLSRQFTVFGSAIFCVVIFSLYLMLDRGHLDYPKSPRREGSFPQVSTEGVGFGGVVIRRSSPSTSRGGCA